MVIIGTAFVTLIIMNIIVESNCFKNLRDPIFSLLFVVAFFYSLYSLSVFIFFENLLFQPEESQSLLRGTDFNLLISGSSFGVFIYLIYRIGRYIEKGVQKDLQKEQNFWSLVYNYNDDTVDKIRLYFRQSPEKLTEYVNLTYLEQRMKLDKLIDQLNDQND